MAERREGDHQAADHDMGCKEKYTPFGIVDEDTAQLSVIFGSSAKTSDFIVDSLVHWWEHLPLTERLDVSLLQIKLDNGPESSGRRTQFLIVWWLLPTHRQTDPTPLLPALMNSRSATSCRWRVERRISRRGRTSSHGTVVRSVEMQVIRSAPRKLKSIASSRYLDRGLWPKERPSPTGGAGHRSPDGLDLPTVVSSAAIS